MTSIDALLTAVRTFGQESATPTHAHAHARKEKASSPRRQRPSKGGGEVAECQKCDAVRRRLEVCERLLDRLFMQNQLLKDALSDKPLLCDVHEIPHVVADPAQEEGAPVQIKNVRIRRSNDDAMKKLLEFVALRKELEATTVTV
eukprot:GEMP01103466.1.p1 GENE.GEMP01103466.1~~GEMP01103466.1.p1  ORF type:complete len:164 (+),score=38.31 GEMP01103466.1:60-494(+)